MTLKVGDRVEYKGDTIDGKYPQGKIVTVIKNRRGFITDYFVDIGGSILVQFKPHNLNWYKLDE